MTKQKTVLSNHRTAIWPLCFSSPFWLVKFSQQRSSFQKSSSLSCFIDTTLQFRVRNLVVFLLLASGYRFAELFGWNLSAKHAHSLFCVAALHLSVSFNKSVVFVFVCVAVYMFLLLWFVSFCLSSSLYLLMPNQTSWRHCDPRSARSCYPRIPSLFCLFDIFVSLKGDVLMQAVVLKVSEFSLVFRYLYTAQVQWFKGNDSSSSFIFDHSGLFEWNVAFSSTLIFILSSLYSVVFFFLRLSEVVWCSATPSYQLKVPIFHFCVAAMLTARKVLIVVNLNKPNQIASDQFMWLSNPSLWHSRPSQTHFTSSQPWSQVHSQWWCPHLIGGIHFDCKWTFCFLWFCFVFWSFWFFVLFCFLIIPLFLNTNNQTEHQTFIISTMENTDNSILVIKCDVVEVGIRLHASNCGMRLWSDLL